MKFYRRQEDDEWSVNFLNFLSNKNGGDWKKILKNYTKKILITCKCKFDMNDKNTVNCNIYKWRRESKLLRREKSLLVCLEKTKTVTIVESGT